MCFVLSVWIDNLLVVFKYKVVLGYGICIDDYSYVYKGVNEEV